MRLLPRAGGGADVVARQKAGCKAPRQDFDHPGQMSICDVHGQFARGLVTEPAWTNSTRKMKSAWHQPARAHPRIRRSIRAGYLVEPLGIRRCSTAKTVPRTLPIRSCCGTIGLVNRDKRGLFNQIAAEVYAAGAVTGCENPEAPPTTGQNKFRKERGADLLRKNLQSKTMTALFRPSAATCIVGYAFYSRKTRL